MKETFLEKETSLVKETVHMNETSYERKVSLQMEYYQNDLPAIMAVIRAKRMFFL